jgi:acetolactate synthase-1/2/3 large subunit
MTGGQYLLQAIRDQGVGHAFLVPGGHIDPLVAELGKGMRLQPIVAAHEQGAGFMADGYARVSGRFGACFCIGGPGAGNILPAAVAARSDRSRVLFITGDVPTALQGRGAFQDGSVDGTSDAAFLQPATVYSEEVELASQLPRQLAAAFRAMFGIPAGPAHLSIPSDLQKAEVPAAASGWSIPWQQPRPVDAGALARIAAQVLNGATRMAILAGRGAMYSGAGEAIRSFAETFNVPVATTFAAKGLLPDDHRLALGMFGYAGSQRAVSALLADDLDVLLVLGSSMNLRDTLYWSRELTGRRQIIQVDIDPGMLGRDYPVSHCAVGDCAAAIALLNSWADGPLKQLAATAQARQSWVADLANLTGFYDGDNMASNAAPIHPARVLAQMRHTLPRDTILFVDSGAHRAFAGHYWNSFSAGAVRSATNLGPMGWAIAAAIGGKLAQPDAPVAVVTGDGCMRMHGMEIATAARYRIPVIFVVSNNSALGNVYMRAKKDNPGAAEITSLPAIDWAAFGRVLGAAGRRVERPEDLCSAIEEALAARVPFVVDVVTQRDCPTPVGPYNQMAVEYEHGGRV